MGAGGQKTWPPEDGCRAREHNRLGPHEGEGAHLVLGASRLLGVT